MKTHHRIIIGDSRLMKEVAAESVHLVVTSPPYWQLKDYGNGKQIGFSDSYEDYINNLNLVWSECHRVLHKGCRLCVNIGDQFARSVYYGRYKIIPIRTKEERSRNREAVQFLRNRTRGQKVFLRFDVVKYDDRNNLLSYLYLSNKTFLNAHLIKNGLADPDTTFQYKHKPKFLALRDAGLKRQDASQD